MVAAAALLLFACKPEPVKVNGVTLNHKTLTLEVGRTETLKESRRDSGRCGKQSGKMECR